MPFTYIVRCYTRGCGQEAEYKIASRWSDGVTGELKTYSICCAVCLPDHFRESRRKQTACRTALGETLEPPGIYRLQRGQRDQKLTHLPELERTLLAEG